MNMFTTTRHHILTAALSAATVLLLCPVLQANQTITLNSTPNCYPGNSCQNPDHSVGPYTASVTGVIGDLLVYCLDGNKTTYGSSNGTLYTFDNRPASQTAFTQKEEEAAFLAAYSLTLDPSGTKKVDTVEGPISWAIWEIMGTTPDPKYVTLTTAQQATVDGYKSLALAVVLANPTVFAPNSAFMKTVSVWIPDTWPDSEQRFISAGKLPAGLVPEPGTIVFLSTGVFLLALSQLRRRK